MKVKNKGITLIALVITIIILLILAGVTIGQLAGNGLFDKVKLAKEESEEAQKEENATLDNYENKIGQYRDGTRNENENNYSFDEIEIGKWVDGKTLYRKVYIQDTTDSVDISDLNYDYIQVVSRVYYKSGNNVYWWNDEFYHSAEDRFLSNVNDTQKTINYISGSITNVQKIVSIVEYTKNI